MRLENTVAYLLLGGNLGKREENLDNALVYLEAEVGEVLCLSSVYETAPWGKTDQPAFLNQAISVRTNLGALALLDQVLSIEKKLGRVRKEKWGERLIDIDLLLYGDEIIDGGDKLRIPHPHMHERGFVMLPLAEIAPQVVHPVLKKTILQISREITNKLDVKKL